jgi:hypothetical protein
VLHKHALAKEGKCHWLQFKTISIYPATRSSTVLIPELPFHYALHNHATSSEISSRARNPMNVVVKGNLGTLSSGKPKVKG